VALTAPLLLGCGASVFSPSRGATFELDTEKEINDEDVRKAFDAKPQLSASVRVAYYAFDEGKTSDVEALLGRLPGVVSVYRIPPLLVTGQRRYDEPRPWDPPKEVGIKKLRVLAARAHADLLVVVDDGRKTEWSGNGFAAFTVALVPALFVPFRDVTVRSYADAFVIDTRNGYLYGHLTAEEVDSDQRLTIYSHRDDELAEAQWPRLLASLETHVSRLLRDERAPASRMTRAAPSEREGSQ
jgi:hypothetical protein